MVWIFLLITVITVIMINDQLPYIPGHKGNTILNQVIRVSAVVVWICFLITVLRSPDEILLQIISDTYILPVPLKIVFIITAAIVFVIPSVHKHISEFKSCITKKESVDEANKSI